MNRKFRKIDLHTHILPETLPDLERRYGYGGFIRLEPAKNGRARMMLDGVLFRECDENLWNPARRLEECDRSGVEIQVLSTVPAMFGYWAKAEHALDLARLLNDHIHSVVQAHPGRFVGLGTIPLQSPEAAIREMERCVVELGLAGVEIGTHVNGWNLDHPRLFPVFQAAQDLGAAIFVHPWQVLGQERLKKYWLEWLVGMPAETSLAICSLIFGGVLERLPGLRICFAHGGGAFPGTLGRIRYGYQVRPDLCGVDNAADPGSYLGKFYLDSLVHDADTLRFLLKLVGPERVALGTDYPFPLGEASPGQLIESMRDLDPGTRERLLAGSAREFLGLDQKVPSP